MNSSVINLYENLQKRYELSVSVEDFAKDMQDSTLRRNLYNKIRGDFGDGFKDTWDEFDKKLTHTSTEQSPLQSFEEQSKIKEIPEDVPERNPLEGISPYPVYPKEDRWIDPFGVTGTTPMDDSTKAAMLNESKRQQDRVDRTKATGDFNLDVIEAMREEQMHPSSDFDPVGVMQGEPQGLSKTIQQNQEDYLSSPQNIAEYRFDNVSSQGLDYNTHVEAYEEQKEIDKKLQDGLITKEEADELKEQNQIAAFNKSETARNTYFDTMSPLKQFEEWKKNPERWGDRPLISALKNAGMTESASSEWVQNQLDIWDNYKPYESQGFWRDTWEATKQGIKGIPYSMSIAHLEFGKSLIRTFADETWEEGLAEKGLNKFDETIHKVDIALKPEMKDIGGFAGLVGGTIPFVTIAATAAVTRNPHLMRMSTYTFFTMGAGEGFQAYREFRGEEGSDAGAFATAMLYGAAYSVSIGKYIGKLKPAQQAIMKKVLPHTVGTALGNPVIAEKLGVEILNNFAKQSPSLAKSMTKSIAQSIGGGIMTMEKINLTKLAVDKFLIDKNITPEMFWDTVYESAKSGAFFGITMTPFAVYNNYQANESVKARRESAGLVELSTDTKGNPVELIRVQKSDKSKLGYMAITPEGKIVETTQGMIDSKIEISTQNFYETISTMRKFDKGLEMSAETLSKEFEARLGKYKFAEGGEVEFVKETGEVVTSVEKEATRFDGKKHTEPHNIYSLFNPETGEQRTVRDIKTHKATLKEYSDAIALRIAEKEGIPLKHIYSKDGVIPVYLTKSQNAEAASRAEARAENIQQTEQEATRAKYEAMVDPLINPDTGTIIDAEINGDNVRIAQGKIVLGEDGKIDLSKSDSQVSYVHEGRIKVTPVSGDIKILSNTSREDAIEGLMAEAMIKTSEEAKLQRDEEALQSQPFSIGETAEVTTDNGIVTTQIDYVNEDGTYNIAVEFEDGKVESLNNVPIGALEKHGFEVPEEFKAIQESLVETSPEITPEAQNIEAKKADIERRRQEELSKSAENKFTESVFKTKVYHASKSKDNIIENGYDFSKIGSTTDLGAFGSGMYFYTDKKTAIDSQYNNFGYNEDFTEYTGSDKNVIENYIDVKNPYNWNDNPLKITPEQRDANPKAVTDMLLENGYDGAMFTYDGGGQTEVVVFNPSQIKITNSEKEINAKYDAELAELEKQPQAAGETPVAEQQAEQEKQTFIESLPVNNKGKIDQSRMTPEQTIKYFEYQIGQTETAKRVGLQVKNLSEKLAKEAERLESNPMDIDQNEVVSTIQDELNIYKSYLDNLRAERADKAAAEAKEREVSKAKRELSEKEQEISSQIAEEEITGVPDILTDTAVKARNRGFRMVNGVKVERQPALETTKFKPATRKFSTKKEDNVSVKRTLIEKSSLQPSHKGGQENSLHFIPEAQPKKRTDKASIVSSTSIASNINPREITEGVTAYTGAPIVNPNAEVVQGNNRANALIEMYNQFSDQAEIYKNHLIQHAEDYGMTKEEVIAMKEPVAVDILEVSDEEAIRLGQLSQQDLESGGEQRIPAKQTAVKLADKMESFNRILFDTDNADAPMSDILSENGKAAAKFLAEMGVINDTQYQSMFNIKGELTPEAKKDLSDIASYSLFEGGSDNLPKMFEVLPDKAKKAILQTIHRDLKSEEGVRIKDQVQAAIELYYLLQQDADFVAATTLDDLRLTALAAKNQFALFNSESSLPLEKYSNFAFELAALFKGESQKALRQRFNNFYDAVQGLGNNLFEETEQLSRTEAIKKHFNNVDYVPNGQIQRNNVVEHPAKRKEGQQGEPTGLRVGEQNKEAVRTADDRGGVDTNPVEQEVTETPKEETKPTEKEVGEISDELKDAFGELEGLLRTEKNTNGKLSNAIKSFESAKTNKEKADAIKSITSLLDEMFDKPETIVAETTKEFLEELKKEYEKYYEAAKGLKELGNDIQGVRLPKSGSIILNAEDIYSSITVLKTWIHETSHSSALNVMSYAEIQDAWKNEYEEYLPDEYKEANNYTKMQEVIAFTTESLLDKYNISELSEDIDLSHLPSELSDIIRNVLKDITYGKSRFQVLRKGRSSSLHESKQEGLRGVEKDSRSMGQRPSRTDRGNVRNSKETSSHIDIADIARETDTRNRMNDISENKDVKDASDNLDVLLRSIDELTPEQKKIKLQEASSKFVGLAIEKGALKLSEILEVAGKIKPLSEAHFNAIREGYLLYAFRNPSVKGLDGYEKIQSFTFDQIKGTAQEKGTPAREEGHPEQTDYTEKYHVKKEYEGEGDFILRFTNDATEDMKNLKSRWYIDDAELEWEKDNGSILDRDYFYDEDVGMHYKEHSGLSGHKLDAMSLKDAINEVTSKKQWYKNSLKDNWAIFENDYNAIVTQDTPEGETFIPYKILYEREISIKTDSGLKENTKPLPKKAKTEVEESQEVTVIDTEIESQQPNTNPSEAQKEAGNYKKAHITVSGFDITIENPKGSERSGVDENGKEWSIEMNNHYGYFKRTEGKDGDQIDVFVGDNTESNKIFVIDQTNPNTGEFDESKVMLGFNSLEEARAAYLSNYEEGWQGLGAVTEVSVEDFKKWLYDGAQQRKAFSEYKEFEGDVKEKKGYPEHKPIRQLGTGANVYLEEGAVRVNENQKGGYILSVEQEGAPFGHSYDFDSLDDAMKVANKILSENGTKPIKDGVIADKYVENIKKEVLGKEIQKPTAAKRPPIVVATQGKMPAPKDRVGSTYDIDDDQKLGVNLALARFLDNKGKSFVLADGTGVGKTRQILATAAEFKKKTGKPVLIVTQNRQIIANNFAKDAQAMGINAAEFELVTYDDIRTGKLKSSGYGLVIYDEAHNLKNEESLKTIAAKRIKTDHKMHVTATPMDTPVGSAYFISEVTDIPVEEVMRMMGLEMRSKDILDKEGKPTGEKQTYVVLAKGANINTVQRNIIRLRDQMIEEGSMLRREYPFFGEINVRESNLTEEQLKEQSQIESYWEEVENNSRNANGYIHPSKLMSIRGQKSGELSRWNEQLKVKEIFDSALKDVKDGKKVIIIAEGINPTYIKALEKDVPGFIGAIELMFKNAGIQTAQVYGSGNKATANELFQSGKVDVVIGTPGSASTGIDLDDQIGNAPRVMYIATPNYSGNTFQQTLGRVSRRNTASPADVKVVMNNSISDARRQEIVVQKINTLKAIQDGQIADETDLTGVLTETQVGDFNITDYGKGFIVKGDTRPYKESFKEIGGRWNPKEQGWMFSNDKRSMVEALQEKEKSTAPVIKQGQSLLDFAKDIDKDNDTQQLLFRTRPELLNAKEELQKAEDNLRRAKTEYNKAINRHSELNSQLISEYGMKDQMSFEGFETAPQTAELDFGEDLYSIAKRTVMDAKDDATVKYLKLKDAQKRVDIAKDNVINAAHEQQSLFDSQVLFRAIEEESNAVKSNLVALHNIDELKLSQALKIGGLPMPSIAVTMSDSKFTGYGDITFIAPVGLIDPSKKSNKVFSADAYSPRYPSIHYTLKNSKPIESALKESHPDIAKTIISGIKATIEQDGLRNLMYSQYVKYLFGIDSGMDASPVYYDSGISQNIKDKVEKLNAYDYLDISNNESNLNEFREIYKEYVNEQYSQDSEQKNFMFELIEGEREHNILRNTFDNIKRAIKNDGKIDIYKSIKKVTEQVDTANSWREEGVRTNYFFNLLESLDIEEKIFKGYTPTGTRSYSAHTAENALKEMKKESVVGAESHWGTLGVLRARASEQFKSLADIEKAKGRIQSEEAIKIERDAAKVVHEEILEKIAQYYKFSSRGFIDIAESFSEDMNDIIRDGQSQSFHSIPEELRNEIKDLKDVLKNVPVGYFEAKPQRIVGINEFSAVAVPSYINKGLYDALIDLGLKVEMYNSENRTEVVSKLADEYVFAKENIGKNSNKLSGVEYPDMETEGILFKLGKRRREEYESRLEKRRPDLTTEERNNFLDFLDKEIDDNNVMVATFKWFAEGTIILPEDMYKVNDAIEIAKRHKVDPLQYENPMDLINSFPSLKIKDERINPDNVPTLTKVKEFDNGVVIYDVENTREGQKDMREIINTHFGKDASPWCLLQANKDGVLTESSWDYWNNYNSIPKQAALQNGELISFRANNSDRLVWWDRNDKPGDGVPYRGPIAGDELGRSAEFRMNAETGEMSDILSIYKGSESDGLYQEWWTLDPNSIKLSENRKSGLLNGKRIKNYKNGQLKTSEVYVNGELIEIKKYSNDVVPEGLLQAIPEKGESLIDFASRVDENNNNEILFRARKEQPVEITLSDGTKKTVKQVNAEIINGFYSPIENAIHNIKQPKGTGEQMLAILKKEKGVKSDELVWIGIEDWLKGQKSVTKEQILDYIKNNRVQIVEVVKGEPSESDIDTFLADEVGEGMTREEAREYLMNDEDATKYKAYQLEGEKSNYKEVLITMPFEKDGWEEFKNVADGKVYKSPHWNEPNILVHLRVNTRETKIPNENYLDPKTYKPKFDDAYELVDVGDSYKVKEIGKSDPFFNSYSKKLLEEHNMTVDDLKEYLMADTELGKNHPDFKENKKDKKVTVLFLEELQSDWAQQGRNKGFNQKTTPNINIIKEGESYIVQRDGQVIWEGKDKERADEIIRRERSKFNSKTPQSPFVTNTEAWTKLGLKVALQKAVEAGADKIAWTTGEQQNKRYNLNKQVDEVHTRKDENGNYTVLANKDGKDVFTHSDIKENKLSDYIGKELAGKVIDYHNNISIDWNKYSGLDLEVGSSGMKVFYGSPTENSKGIIGSTVEKLIKELTGEKGVIETVNIAGEENHAIAITPEMKNSVESGLPLFRSIREYEDGELSDFAKTLTEINESGVMPEKIIINGVEKPTQNSEGKFIHNTVQGIKNFWDWFGDSKMIDDKGSPLVLYHGTPKYGFTVFGEESYFTESKDYAKRYQNPNASQIYKGTPVEKGIYETYLSIKKPFDTRNEAERKIFYDEFYRKMGNGSELSERGLPDWTDASDLLEFAKEKGYDGIVIDEGGDGGYGEEVKLRGASYVPISPNQIKSATDNTGKFDEGEASILFKLGKVPTPPVITGDMSAAEMATKVNDYNNAEKEVLYELQKNMNEILAVPLKKHVDRARPLENLLHSLYNNHGFVLRPETDAYNYFIRSRGVVHRLIDEYQNLYIKPLQDVARKLLKESSLKDVPAYKWNIIDENTGKLIKKNVLSNYDMLSVYLQAKDIVEAKRLGLVDRGEVGFTNTVMDKDGNPISPEVFIEQFEGASSQENINALWDAIRKTNKWALDLQFNKGMIDEEAYKRYTDESREFYVPQRGWRERDESMIDLQLFDDENISYTNPYNAALIKAKGRTSLAGDPLAYIQSIGESTAMSVVKNETNQRFLEFAIENADLGKRHDVFEIHTAYYKNTGKVDGDGNTIFERTYEKPDKAELDEDKAIRDELKKISQAKREAFKNLSNGSITQAQYDRFIERQTKKEISLRNGLNVIYRGTEAQRLQQMSNKEKAAHTVTVEKDGKEYDIQFTGRYKGLDVANVLNRKFNTKDMSVFMRGFNKGTRFMSAMATQYNPAFAAVNMFYDLPSATVGNIAERGLAYQGKFIYNFFRAQKVIWSYTTKDAFGGDKYNVKSKLNKFLQEFFEDGAATGHSYLKDLDQLRSDMKKNIDPTVINSLMEGNFGAKNAFGLKQLFSLLTKATELSTRFGVYLTSREETNPDGTPKYTREQCALHAKDASVNFDRQGSFQVPRGVFAFYNAAIQGTNKYARIVRSEMDGTEPLIRISTGETDSNGDPIYRDQTESEKKEWRKKNKSKARRVVASAFGYMFAHGFLQGLLLGGGDDDDSKREWTEWELMTNLIIGRTKIPLGQVLRGTWGAGVQMGLMLKGEKDIASSVLDANTFMIGEFMPDQLAFLLNAAEVDETTGKFTMDFNKAARSITPSVAQPVYDVAFNTNFMGGDIYRSEYLTTQKGTQAQRALGKKNVAKSAQDLSDFIWVLGGGDVADKSRLKANKAEYVSPIYDVNPSKVQHIVESYGGGVGRFIMDIHSIATDAIEGKLPDMSKTGVGKRFYKQPREYTRVDSKYWEANRKMKKYNEQINLIKKENLDRYIDMVSFYDENKDLRNTSPVEYRRKLEKYGTSDNKLFELYINWREIEPHIENQLWEEEDAVLVLDAFNLSIDRLLGKKYLRKKDGMDEKAINVISRYMKE